MLDYKEIVIKHYGGGMSGRALAEQGLGSKSGINDFLSAFEACERLSFPLPEGITSIWYSAFRDCSSLTEITLPEVSKRHFWRGRKHTSRSVKNAA